MFIFVVLLFFFSAEDDDEGDGTASSKAGAIGVVVVENRRSVFQLYVRSKQLLQYYFDCYKQQLIW